MGAGSGMSRQVAGRSKTRCKLVPNFFFLDLQGGGRGEPGEGGDNRESKTKEEQREEEKCV